MHILILPSEEFVPERTPMLGIFQLDQAKILHEAGFDVGVISVSLQYSLPMLLKAIFYKLIGKRRNNKTDKFSFFQLINLLLRKLFLPGSFIQVDHKYGFPAYRVEGFYLLPPNQKHDYKWWKKAGKRAVRKYINDNGKPDVMHTHIALNAGLLAGEIKRNYDIPYWLTERISFFARNLYHPSLLPLAKEAYINADRVFTVSNFLGRGLQQIFPDFNYDVFPNTVDPIIEAKPLQSDKSPEFTFVSIGSLIPLKRHRLLVEAFNDAFAGVAGVRLLIIGEGSERENLEKVISHLGAGEQIEMKGELSKEQILDQLDQCHVLCHTSDYETFGVAVLEAQFRGLPVISTKCGGPQEIITEETGYLVEKDNMQELAAALVAMKENFTDFDATIIRNYAIENFGREAFLSRIRGFMTDLKEKAAK